jgi:hypothetical protein
LLLVHPLAKAAVGVKTVGLAPFAPLGRAGPVDLDDPDPRGGNGGGDPDPVAGGALDTDRLQRAVTDQPGDRPSVPGRAGRELPVIDLRAQASVDRDFDRVLVRVDTADRPVPQQARRGPD